MANYDSVLTGLELDSSGAAIKNAVSGFTGSGAAQTADDLSIDNLKLDGNTLSSTDAGGHINLTPNGAGIVKTDNLGFDGNTISSTDSNGNIILAPNGTGIVMGTTLAFCHNFNDDAEDDINYLPWADATEGGAGGRKSFLAPFDMVLNKISWRAGNVNAHEMTISVCSVDDATVFNAGHTDLIGSATQEHDGTDHKVYSSVESDFNARPLVAAGKMAVITFLADVDCGGNDWYVSSIWTLKV